MTIHQYVYDDFNDNSIDTARWSRQFPGSDLQSETGGRFLTPVAASAAPTIMRSGRNWYDLRRGRLGVRFSKSGTTDGNVYTYFGIRDINNNYFTLFGRSSDHSLQIATNTLGAGTGTQLETTVGMGPSWVANSWLGWTYNESTKTYSLSKSTNATTWTDIFRYVVTTPGAFNPKLSGFILGAISYGTVTNFTPSWDDASYFTDHTQLYNRVRYNGAWVNASPKIWLNGAWRRPIVKVLANGSAYVRPK